MTTETTRAKARLATLSNSLSELEIHLEPLFSQSLPETLLPLEPIQQARLQTLLSYVSYDLIFIYLKSRGIDPRTHPIVSELDRIKQYFDKVDKAETVDTRRHEIDKAAAGRFIKHAITQAKLGQLSETHESEVGASSTARVPVRVTSKMTEREQYRKEMKERDDAEGSDEGNLEFIGVDETETPAASSTKGKGKAKGDVQPPVVGSKRQRPVIDPFAASGVIDKEEQAKPVQDITPTPKKKKQKTKLKGEDTKEKKVKKKTS